MTLAPRSRHAASRHRQGVGFPTWLFEKARSDPRLRRKNCCKKWKESRCAPVCEVAPILEGRFLPRGGVLRADDGARRHVRSLHADAHWNVRGILTEECEATHSFTSALALDEALEQDRTCRVAEAQREWSVTVIRLAATTETGIKRPDAHGARQSARGTPRIAKAAHAHDARECRRGQLWYWRMTVP